MPNFYASISIPLCTAVCSVSQQYRACGGQHQTALKAVNRYTVKTAYNGPCTKQKAVHGQILFGPVNLAQISV